MNIDESLKNKSGIYRLICQSKSYIGSSQNIYLRLKTHFSRLASNKHINKHLQNAYLKCGEKAFSYEILVFCSIKELWDLETQFIEKFDSFNKGFNQSFIARSPAGYKHTAEAKLKMSVAKKGIKQKPSVILKRTKKLIGRKHSQESVEKQRACKLGEKNPMFGVKQEKDFVEKRMKNCLDTTKWNKNLNKQNDIRILKMSEKLKGRVVHNKISHELIDLENDFSWKANSLTELALICPLGITTLSRLKRQKCGQKISKKYKIIW